jgi:hypothetical protein
MAENATATGTVLICTSCQDAWEPDLTEPFGHTGCRTCGGWTWIGQLAEPVTSEPDVGGGRR